MKTLCCLQFIVIALVRVTKNNSYTICDVSKSPDELQLQLTPVQKSRSAQTTKILEMVSVKHCCFKTCSSDTWYLDKPRMKWVWFLLFSKPITQEEKRDHWIQLCGRVAFDQKNVEYLHLFYTLCWIKKDQQSSTLNPYRQLQAENRFIHPFCFFSCFSYFFRVNRSTEYFFLCFQTGSHNCVCFNAYFCFLIMQLFK